MSEAMERELRALAASVDWPSADVATSVGTELRAGRATRRPLPRLALWPRRRVVALVLIGLLLIAGTAVAAKLAIGAIRIERVPELTTPPASASVAPRSILGRTATPREARGARLPARAALGAPNGIFVAQTPGGERIAATWNAASGAPRLAGTPWSAVLMEFRGTDATAATKEVPVQTRLLSVRVGEAPGYWIRGAHQLVLHDGAVLRLDGTVLIWMSGDVTYRLESNLGLRRALAVARTVL
jgi:hypothetical protein